MRSGAGRRAVVMSWVSSDAMTISTRAVLVCDGAGRHQTRQRLTPADNVNLLRLPPYAPELNPIENVWQHLRGNQLSRWVWDGYDDIVQVNCNAWNGRAGRRLFYASDNDDAQPMKGSAYPHDAGPRTNETTIRASGRGRKDNDCARYETLGRLAWKAYKPDWCAVDVQPRPMTSLLTGAEPARSRVAAIEGRVPSIQKSESAVEISASRCRSTWPVVVAARRLQRPPAGSRSLGRYRRVGGFRGAGGMRQPRILRIEPAKSPERNQPTQERNVGTA
jgi:hypothetical protein